MKGYLLVDGSTIWQDGSRSYPGGKAADPPKTWPYPPPNGTPIEIADETTAQGGAPMTPQANVNVPVLNQNPGPFPPSVPTGIMFSWQPIVPVPASVSDADLFSRWTAMVDTWNRLIAWAGSLDNVAVKIGAPLFQNPYPLGALNDRVAPRTATAIWGDVQSAGYDRAGSTDDLRKGTGAPPFYSYGKPGISVDGINTLIQQLNDTATRAAKAGWSTAPAYQPPSAPLPQPPTPAPPPDAGPVVARSEVPVPVPPSITNTLSDYGQQARSWWDGLSGTTKVVTGGAVALAVIAVLSPSKSGR